MAGSARSMAAVGVVIGVGAAGTLLWNEWRLARSFGALTEAERSLTAGDGRVVRVTGEASATAPAHDPLFGIEAVALRLDRTAETYQWREHREGSGDNKVLRYERVWSPVLIPSRRFEQRTTHANPAALKVEAARFPGGEVRLAGLVLDPALAQRLPATRELFPDRDRPVAAAGLSFRRDGDWLYSGDAQAPAIGDVRARFAAAPSGLVTAIGAEVDGRLMPWRADGGGEVGLAAYGEVPAETLLGEAARGGWREAWALRGFAGGVMFLAALLAAPALDLRGRGRLGTVLLLAVGAWATACAVGWVGARLLLRLWAAGGPVP
jgi:hypothetical protein